jgi:hypothetical protein
VSHGRYILRDKIPVPEDDLLTWADWIENCPKERIVRQEYVGELWVSTCFLGLDHDHFGKGPPLLFETMVFRNANDDDRRTAAANGYKCPARLAVDDGYFNRTATWELALEQHAEAVAWAKEQLS